MPVRSAVLPVAILIAIAAPKFARAQAGSATEAVVTGSAAVNGDAASAEQEAIWDAKRNAIERAAGVLLHSHTVARRFAIDTEEIHATS